ncbi:hypothetical protein FRZ67_21145 [Panacibacter ginsenosidivorans]|uniref:Uncharacterized protein n=1 Tax=Panacibacter ginsenosidivorans TaxID=1813871 RepID=A0A5B8VF23_9BACT|nr:hypothetical protein [Panacibacter ginsenosidivorans]QEC69683.1 hypothetical protein FRZ67_21145 [Panacibacter ginsenosidivorans]
MTKHKFKKMLWISLSTILLLASVLAIHIYMVMKPKAPTANTKIMARFDFKQPIDKTDANTVTAWLYNQKGVDHVLCNEKSGTAVFTFYPIKANADDILNSMRSTLHYNAVRYMPSKEELQSGCPVAAGSFTSKIYNSVTNLFN